MVNLKSTAVLLCFVVFVLYSTALAQIDRYKYLKRDTREETRQATLDQYLPTMTVSDWYVIAPFDNTDQDKHDVVYEPEKDQDLTKTHIGKSGRTVHWQAVPSSDWTRVDVMQLLSERVGFSEADEATKIELTEDGIAYIYREINCNVAGNVTFLAGSDDGLKLWVNGALLIDADEYRGMNIQDHRISVPLRAGKNTLLAKVTQGVGSWEFQTQPHVDTRILAWLEYRLNEDFPTSPEAAHYRLLSVLEPEDVVLEVGGLAVMPDGRPIVATRRGDVWIVDGAYDDPPFDATFTRFAFGLHEPLGGVWHNGGLCVVQRGELTCLRDTNNDDHADVYETICADWGLSGNYHEFAFGPVIDHDGNYWVTLNVGFCGSLGKSIVPWRGWAIRIAPDGSMKPVCGGLRSPCGVGINVEGDVFYTDNQGDWVGTSKLSHLDFGDWHGHPAANRWYEQAGMPEPQSESDFKLPAVWFPYDRMGRSASDITLDNTDGKFGPFTGQLFVGDQYAATVMRVFLEKISGEYQGACFPFRSGLDCGVTRMCFGNDGSMFVGMTNRGWWSFGNRPWGLQRIVYTGIMPFEVKEMRAKPDGFELVFTKPLDPDTASDPARYHVASFTHHRWEKYGSPEIDRKDATVSNAIVSEDGMSVRLIVNDLRPGYVHELTMDETVRSADNEPLLHREAYYTLNRIPQD